MRKSSLIVYGERDVRLHHQFLEDTVNESSITFKPLLMLKGPMQDPLLLAYSFARKIDEIEDNQNIGEEERIALMDKVRAMLFGDKQSAIDLEERLSWINPTEEKFRFLLKNTIKLYDAHESMPDDIKKLTKKYLGEMTNGLRSPGIRNYFNFEGYHQYCHYTTGIIGFLITKILRYGGVFDERDIKKVMPYPESTEIGKNPAHDWGIAIQLYNDIRDFFDDDSQNKHKWPEILFDSRDIKYKDLVKINDTRDKKDKLEAEIEILSEDDPLAIKKRIDLDRTQTKIENIEGAHYDMCKDAREYYIEGIRFIETIPFDNSRGLECFGGIYGVVGATGRVVSSNEFLYNQNKRNITEREFKRIFRIVNKLTKQKRSLRPFLEHVIDKPTEEFEL